LEILGKNPGYSRRRGNPRQRKVEIVQLYGRHLHFWQNHGTEYWGSTTGTTASQFTAHQLC